MGLVVSELPAVYLISLIDISVVGVANQQWEELEIMGLINHGQAWPAIDGLSGPLEAEVVKCC